MAETLQQLIARFDFNDLALQQSLEGLLRTCPADFTRAVPSVLATCLNTPAQDYLIQMLIAAGRFWTILCDPSAFSLTAAVNVAKSSQRFEPLLDVKLSCWLVEESEADRDDARGLLERGLTIMGAVSDTTRIRMTLVQLMRSRNTRVRSKAATLISRTQKSVYLLEKLLKDPDARVRANSVEAFWGTSLTGLRPILFELLNDGNNRVAGNALIALHLLGETDLVHSHLDKMARHPIGLFRATGAWAMARIADARFVPILTSMLKDEDAMVRTRSLASLAAIRRALKEHQGQPLPAPSPIRLPSEVILEEGPSTTSPEMGECLAPATQA